MTELTLGELVDRVTARTKGTAGDPLSRGEVEQVVEATLLELEGASAVTDAPGYLPLEENNGE